jgi:hypothetical protein
MFHCSELTRALVGPELILRRGSMISIARNLTGDRPPMASARSSSERRRVGLGALVSGILGIALVSLAFGAARLVAAFQTAPTGRESQTGASALLAPATLKVIEMPGRLPSSIELRRTEEYSSPVIPFGGRSVRRMGRLGTWDQWWIVGLAVTLGFSGIAYVVASRWLPQTASGTMKVIGRVSLSPKHAVFLLRVERRVLLVGTGPQGAPSFISELDDPSEDTQCTPQEDER